MVNDDFTLFSADPVLTTLEDMSTESLLDGLQKVVPEELLDAPVPSYQLANLRYSPRQKLVIGLTSPHSIRPIALRVFPPGKLAEKLTGARRIYADNVFVLPEHSAIAWVFPAERKLSLGLMNDPSRLNRLLAEHRHFSADHIELMHFVPEHAYTARVDGADRNGLPRCEYLKIHYDNSGEATANRIEQLQAQLNKGPVRVPANVCYVDREKLLLQSSLERDVSRSLTDMEVAAVLARIHGLSVFGLQQDDSNHAGARQLTEELVSSVFPEQFEHVSETNRSIGHALQGMVSERRVVLHGDAHLGNFFPLLDGNIGVIDVDGMRWGAAVEELASFYGFRLWINLRDHQPIDHLLARFPAFIQAYNLAANHSVNVAHAFAMLAQKLVAERVRRGITRGKMVGVQELSRLLSAANACLEEAGYRHVG